MNTQEAVSRRILELCNQYNLAVGTLSTMSAVPPSTLKNIVNGVTQNPGIVTIKKLCDALDITLIDFFNVEMFRDLEPEIK